MKTTIVKGQCDECKIECDNLGIITPERFIVNRSRNLCDYHNKLRLRGGDTKAIQTKTRKFLKKTFRKTTGEAALFKKIWDELEPENRVSFVTGFPLPDQHEMRSYYFSHVLPKGGYPELRLDKENIVLMTLDEHRLWETGKHKIKNNPVWRHVFSLAEKLKLKSNDKSISSSFRKKT